MPLHGKELSSKNVHDESPYFTSLADLDTWYKSNHAKLRNVLDYLPRTPRTSPAATRQGKLLICHDYKGGYTESPSAFSYTFNFWPWCDTFIYFSHHRVTIPPSGWTTAAHRQGVKMLGTLIFEWESSEGDSLRLLFGRLPQSRTGPAAPSADDSVPTSPHYARLLADLALQRGFDGYLLNFEFPLRAGGGIGQTRALAAWIALLEAELKAKVGPHAEVIWYDSVVFTGQVRWQDRLNSYNLPFFPPSTGFFTNYTWPAHFPALTTQFLHSLDPSLTRNKTVQDVYTGVDAWGRGSHGGGGLGSYRALEHIEPPSTGMSVALFGPAWTWESEQDKPGWDWSAWWAYERLLWLGPEQAVDAVDVKPAPRREGEPECPHGGFRPLVAFFERRPPPDPAVLPFHTTFCPGIGTAWFVRGTRVLARDDGWTDMDKQGSIGDLLWPRPTLIWEDADRTDALPEARCAFRFDEAWMGGNSLEVTFTVPDSSAEDAFFRVAWLPIQPLSVTPGKSYEAYVVFKTESDSLDVGLSVKLSSGDTPVSSMKTLLNGWTKLSLQFTSDAAEDVSMGLIVGFVAEDPSEPFSFSILLGQMNVYPSPPSTEASPARARILWADFDRPNTASLAGALTWEVAASFGSSAPPSIPAVEDPKPVWLLDTADHWFPSFLYFNIYAQAHLADGRVEGPEQASFIGTTGLDGRANRLYIEREMLPESAQEAKAVRFYVQGVTDKGQVLGWDQCCFVDV